MFAQQQNRFNKVAGICVKIEKLVLRLLEVKTISRMQVCALYRSSTFPPSFR